MMIRYCIGLLFVFLLNCQGKQPEKSVFDLQGHRGARGLMPENSIPAFLKALDYQVTTLELDVVVSKDQQIIVSHEPFLSADICLDSQGKPLLKDSIYNLYQMSVTEIQACDCGSKPHARFPEQQKIKTYKPTLKEVIQAVENTIQEKKLPFVYYNIETKSTPEGDNLYHPSPEIFAQLLYKELQDAKIIDKVLIQSFDVRTLQAMKVIAPEIPLVLLVENDFSFEKNLELLGFTPAVYSPYFPLVDKKLIDECHQKGIKIIPWTVNEITDMKKLKKMGVDGFITDYPDRYRKLFPQ